MRNSLKQSTSRTVGKVPKEYLPQTYEQQTLEWWEKNRIYEKVKKLLEGKPKYYFVDGPPYVTNPPHVGTAWNKLLKDCILRYKRMAGYDVRDQPGYDCHGLPIEVRVEEDLGIKSKKEIEDSIGIENFIEKCKEYAVENVKLQTEIFKNLGVWMAWEKPYITFEDDYIESVWWTIKRIEEKGLLEKGLRVVHWCPRCGTALAGYEVTDEYRIVRDYSVYVKFPVAGKEREYILIWTTTPWTLPVNVAVMVHPDNIYVKVAVGDEAYLLAENRCRDVFGQIGVQYQVLDKFKGEQLNGLRYKPPLLEEVTLQSQLQNAHMVVLSREYVTVEEGTGCVHIAPGHGEEDFEVGQQYRLPIACPVNERGAFTQDAGKYAGSYVVEANKAIIEDLSKKELLLHQTIVEHSYPHCWRCKTPLLLRATSQWVVKVTNIKDKLLEENEEVVWVPDWAGTRRFKDWLLGARDWVISRQRYWGVPLPIWICEKCGRKTVIGSKNELKEKAGGLPPNLELHRQFVDAMSLKCDCNEVMKRVPDTVDVWMDSGVASWACLQYPKSQDEYEKWWPADLVLEAHDQTRGWFYTQLVSSVAAFDKRPYKSVLMHGHTLDSSGQKMSKSLGNFISPMDVIPKYGRDPLRLYELQCTLWDDFRFSWDEVAEVRRSIQVIWNIFVFASLYLNLDGFSPSKWPIEKAWRHMRPEDKWLLSKTESLKTIMTKEMKNLNVHLAIRALNKFALEDLSRWYVKLVRRRFWLERESRDKIASYSALYYALKNWVMLSAPYTPFLAEKLYQAIVKPAEIDAPESVHMCSWPEPDARYLDPNLEEEMELAKEIVGAIASARQTRKIKLRQPVQRVIVVTDNLKVEKTVRNLEKVVFEQANTKSFEFVSPKEEEKLKKIHVEPKFEALGPVFKAETMKIADAIRGLDGARVLEKLRENDKFETMVNGKHLLLTPEMFSFREEMPENFILGSFSQGRVYVDTSLPEVLRQEGLVRDVVRRLQEMRRQMNLSVDAFVSACIVTPTKKDKNWLEKRRSYIKEEVRAKRLHIVEKKEKIPRLEFKRTWEIDKKKYEMGLELLTEKA